MTTVLGALAPKTIEYQLNVSVYSKAKAGLGIVL